MSNIYDFSALRNQARGEAGHRVSEFIPEVARALRKFGITQVHLLYDGSGDCGTIHYPVYYRSQNQVTPHILLYMRAELHVFLAEVLELRYPHWANAEGARGEFIWDVEKDTLTHTHEIRTVTYKPVVRTNL